ncbi:tRNA lysidine(34) synthetase TilS [Fulvimarina sp. MAC8]|uniref:tRNA lysidine(34) synthetase TilS n=1 Tax=Fulvimarina sp. MAC8 TaxID=3162874 RepID=UPI0032EC6E5F
MKLYHPEALPGTEPLSPGDLEDLLRFQCQLAGQKKAPTRLLVAVSGGPDSLALLLLASRLSRSGFAIHAATVDHGLRPEAREEAVYVAEVCKRFDIPHEVLVWAGWNRASNLQAAARTARYRLLADEAYRIGATAILTAHHLNDQIETVLHAMERGHRQSRFAGMRGCRDLEPGLALVRPFLEETPDRLRKVLVEAGIAAVADPSNEDRRFARVRHRQDIAAMSEERIAEIVAIQREAEGRRSRGEQELARKITVMMEQDQLVFDDEAGSVALAEPGFRNLPNDLGEDLLARIVRAIGGNAHPAERAAIGRLAERLNQENSALATTLGGTLVRSDGATILFQREFGRAGPPVIAEAWLPPRLVFDERFDIELSEDEKKLAAARNAVLASYGSTGRGNSRHRTMPALVAADGAVLATTAEVADREQRRGMDTRPFGHVRCRVRWRCLADLPMDNETANRTV